MREEIERLRATWQPRTADGALKSLLPAAALAALDLFDRLQLESVVDVCRRCAHRSPKRGAELFGVSRQKRSVVNDSDRLKKYLQRFGLDWATLSDR